MTTEAGAPAFVHPFEADGPPRTLWAQQVFGAVLEIRGRLARSRGHDEGLTTRVDELTGSALELIRTRPPLLSFGRLAEWWTGSRVETCWTYVHEAELSMVALAEDPQLYPATLARTLSYARRLDPADPDRVALEDLAGLPRRGKQ